MDHQKGQQIPSPKIWNQFCVRKAYFQRILLANVVYFYNCKVFSMRAGDEHRSLTVDQFQLGVSADGTEYLEFTGCSTKTYTGGLKHRKLRYAPKKSVRTGFRYGPDPHEIRSNMDMKSQHEAAIAAVYDGFKAF